MIEMNIGVLYIGYIYLNDKIMAVDKNSKYFDMRLMVHTTQMYMISLYLIYELEYVLGDIQIITQISCFIVYVIMSHCRHINDCCQTISCFNRSFRSYFYITLHHNLLSAYFEWMVTKILHASIYFAFLFFNCFSLSVSNKSGFTK